jgi:choloylglycine hydrolase
MKIKKTLSTFLGLGLSIMMGSALPCSNLLLTGGPGSNIVTSARTMDFEFDLQSKFVLVPRNQSWHSDEPAGAKPGVSWINRFGFVGVNIIEMDHVFADGINEQGLSAALLWLHEANYPAYPATGGGLSLNDVASYLLGQFATAEEAKYALQNLTIWAPPALELKNHVPTMHLMVMDAQGDSFVVEWTKGRQRIYDAISLKQYQTVLTNSPP